MDFNTVLSHLVEALKRALGSKRYASFFTWLFYLGWAKPDWPTTIFTGIVLGGLCWLFQMDAGDDADSTSAPAKVG